MLYSPAHQPLEEQRDMEKGEKHQEETYLLFASREKKTDDILVIPTGKVIET